MQVILPTDIRLDIKSDICRFRLDKPNISCLSRLDWFDHPGVLESAPPSLATLKEKQKAIKLFYPWLWYYKSHDVNAQIPLLIDIHTLIIFFCFFFLHRVDMFWQLQGDWLLTKAFFFFVGPCIFLSHQIVSSCNYYNRNYINYLHTHQLRSMAIDHLDSGSHGQLFLISMA